MTPREIVLAQIKHEETIRVPWTLPMEESVKQRLTEYYGHSRWEEQPNRYIVGVSAVETNMRNQLGDGRGVDGYGTTWRLDRRPGHIDTPALPEPSLANYDFPPPEKFFRPEWKEDAVRVCEENEHRFRIGNLGWGLFERTWTIRGFENALTDVIAEPDFYEELLDRLTELYLAFVEYTVDLPVDGILFGDDWGDQRGIILGPERWRRFLKPRWARIYEAVHSAGKITMSHSCGSVADIMPDIIEIGLDVLESCQPEARGMDPYELKRDWGDKITFWGCLGSQSTIPFGTPHDIRSEVQRLRSEMGRGGGFILAPAKPLQPETPTENAVTLLEVLAEQEDE